MRAMPLRLVVALATLVTVSSARAWSGYQSQIPNGDALFNALVSSTGTGCTMCHRNADGGSACGLGTCPITCTTTNRCHNNFGVLMMAQGSVWTDTLAEQDSDGDGWSNGQEMGDPFNRWNYGGSNTYGSGYRGQPGNAANEPTSTLNVCTVALDDCDALVSCTDSWTGTGQWDCGACPAGYGGSGHDYSGGWVGGSAPYNIVAGSGCTDLNECTLYNRCLEDTYVGINSCTNSTGSYDCVCGTGFVESGTGQARICSDLDECATLNRCREDDFLGINTCTDSTGSYDCTCGTGFTETGTGQSRICADVDECASLNRCREDDFVGTNTCTNATGSYDCTCGAGFSETGTGQSRICADVDECATLNRCREDDFSLLNGCSNSTGSYDCTCGTGFTETGTGQSRVCADVNECTGGNPCREDDFGGVNACTNSTGTYDCTCGAGFTETGTGTTRTCTDVNECLANPCGAQGTGCINTTGAYTCTCGSGYAFDGTSCVVANPCLIPGGPGNGGHDCAASATCTPTGGSTYVCACNAGYTGTGYVSTGGCTDVNECASAGTNDCDGANVICTNVPGTYVCSCANGYEGDWKTACTDIDECELPMDACPGNAACVNAPGTFQCAPCASTATAVEGSPEACVCNPGYAGDGFSCADVNECLAEPCGATEACANSVGSYACIACDPNATVVRGMPDRCVCDLGYAGNGTSCSDVDECTGGTDDCAPEALCVNQPGSFECTCGEGYEGPGTSCSDVDECVVGTDACDALAVCSNTVGGYTCACLEGYGGDGFSCADLDECTLGTDTCSEYASCANDDGGFDCACLPDFVGNGFTCIDAYDCATIVCGQGQRCVDQFGAPGVCECLPGYSPNGPDTCVSGCGNGLLVAGEFCDDGNTTDGDGCSTACTIEAGYACFEPTGTASTCTRTCGDGFVQPPGETCDDGAQNSDTTPGACRTNCRLPGCGDAVLDPGEGCDEGLDNADDRPDRCRTTCQPAFCGDAIVDPARGEVCDPGGRIVLDDTVCGDVDCDLTAFDAGPGGGAAASGCGCTTAGQSSTGSPHATWLALLMGAWVAWSRRRAR